MNLIMYNVQDIMSKLFNEYNHNIDKEIYEKNRIRKDWQESKNLPRKKKKQKRKELIIDWKIANW